MPSLTIPADARCSIVGCRGAVTHLLAMRMRRKDTGADWAPNTHAYFCTPHATDGAKLTILYEPNQSGEVQVEVAATKTAVSRTTQIKKRNGRPI
jgi:hypothetical protein